MDRPEFKKLLQLMQPGDMFIVRDLPRFARTALEGAQIINGLIDKGITVNVLKIGILDNSPSNKLIRSILLAIAEFDRDCIVERTQEGKALARLKPGFKEGRPRVYTKEQRSHAWDLLQAGKNYKEVEQMTGISKSTLQRIRRENNKEMNILSS